jgi:hypothetical protein
MGIKLLPEPSLRLCSFIEERVHRRRYLDNPYGSLPLAAEESSDEAVETLVPCRTDKPQQMLSYWGRSPGIKLFQEGAIRIRGLSEMREPDQLDRCLHLFRTQRFPSLTAEEVGEEVSPPWISPSAGQTQYTVTQRVRSFYIALL